MDNKNFPDTKRWNCALGLFLLLPGDGEHDTGDRLMVGYTLLGFCEKDGDTNGDS